MLSPYDIRDPNPMGSSSTIPLPMMASTESLRINSFERNTGIWYLLKHNWRQLTSLAPGILLLCATGNLHVSWTIWQIFMSVFHYQEVNTTILLAWFVGAATGILTATFLNQAWSKICIYYFVAVSLLPVSILFVLHQTTAYNLLLIGRLLAGILYGITLMTFLLHIADNSSQLMRRYFVWTIPIISALPTVLFAETISTITHICDPVATIGGLMFVLAIFTLIFMPCTYESIIFLLESGNDLRALEIMLKLRNESRHFIRRDFNEFKMMLAEDISDTGSTPHTGYYRPLFAVLLLRILNALAASNAIYWIFLANLMLDFQNWTLLSSTANMQIGNVTMPISDIANISRFGNETEYLTKPNDLFGTTTTMTPNNLYNVSDDILEAIFNTTDIPDIDNRTEYLTETNDLFDTTTTVIMTHNYLHDITDDNLEAISTTTYIPDIDDINGTTTMDTIDSTSDSTTDISAVPATNNISLLSNDTLWMEESHGITENISAFVINKQQEHFHICDQQNSVAYSLSFSEISQFIMAVVAIKIVVGIIVMCVAESFKIYRNRIILKVTLWIGLVNATFFLLTLICYRLDDNLLFTFYMSKLVNLIYASYLLIAFAIDTIGYCELAESFSLATRYRYMAAVLICEHSIYGGAILLIMNAQYTFYMFVLQSVVVCIISYCLLRFMPNECLDQTLRAARDKHFVKIASANS